MSEFDGGTLPQATPNEDQNVPHLSDANFEQELSDKSAVLVMFYAPCK